MAKFQQGQITVWVEWIVALPEKIFKISFLHVSPKDTISKFEHCMSLSTPAWKFRLECYFHESFRLLQHGKRLVLMFYLTFIGNRKSENLAGRPPHNSSNRGWGESCRIEQNIRERNQFAENQVFCCRKQNFFDFIFGLSFAHLVCHNTL